MKKLLIAFSLLWGVLPALRAQQSPEMNGNWCGTDEAFKLKLTENPALEQELKDFVYNRANNPVPSTKSLKIIPTVVHVIHDNGVGNISDAQILDAIERLNIDYNRQNPDTLDTRNTANAPFSPQAASMDVSFRLAKVDPNGNCTSGILRVNGPNATHNVDMGSEPHKFSASGGSNAWPRDKYFNIWVVNTIGDNTGTTFVAGYAEFPSANSSNTYGFTVRHDKMGTIGTASNNSTGLRVVTHEVGHCFGLMHIFQPTSWWNGMDGCHTDDCYSTGDGCCDTPPQEEAFFSCNLTLNSCTDVPTNDTYGTDVLDQVENYMSYNPCQNMFTQDQAAIMESMFTQFSWAANLISAANVDYTGVNEPEVLCQAEFLADRQSICAGDMIQFTDMSYNAASGWSWTFAGGTPASSTDQNPSITYNTPGLYEVSLTATDGTNNSTETKTSFIRVLAAPSNLPFLEGFENYTSLANIEEWEVDNSNGEGFEMELNAGHNSAKSVRLQNHGETEGSIDELISAPVDLSGVSSNVTLSFRYAYNRRNTTDDDFLRVYATSDCGETWGLRKTLHGFLLSSDIQATPYTPSSEDDWVTVHLTNITNNFFVENFRYKFNFQSGGGNNFYLDNINIYPGSPSDDLVLGLDDIKELGGLAVYPNPVDNDLNVEFSVNSAMQTTVEIQDLTGKIVSTQNILANAGVNKVFMHTQELSSGMYFLNIRSGNAQETVQFVVK